MAKKFGKFLLFTAAVTTAAAAAYYFIHKKDAASVTNEEEDEDYDNFHDDLEDDAASSRTYVPLNREEAENAGQAESPEAAPEKNVESVEEFFNDESPE